MSDNSRKFYPPASSEIAKLLGLEPDRKDPVVTVTHTVVAPHGLPVVDVESKDIDAALEEDERALGIDFDHDSQRTAHTVDKTTKKTNPGRTVLVVVTGILPYLAVFAVGVLIYYFYFADPSNRPTVSTKPQITAEEQQKIDRQKAIDQIKKDQGAKYTAWISQFYFDVSDTTVIDPDTIDKNGLTNFENYLLQLNPKGYDTLQNGKSDAANILDGINPKTGLALTDAEHDIIAKYFDLEAIKQRINYLPSPATTSSNNTTVIPLSSNPTNTLAMNTTTPGRLEIPSIGVNVPIIWTTDPANFDTDLKTGVVHYPGTPFPGSPGTSYISGHSSNYAWIKADYNKVFANIDKLPVGGTFKITVVGKNGKNIFLHYIVTKQEVYTPDDQAQFTNYADSVVALSTCWPINTNTNRRVAFGKLSKVEYE